MRRFPFLITRHALALLLALNVALLGISIYLGLMSAKQMLEIVKEDFNQQQLVLARHTASLLEQDINFLKRELNTLNYSPAIQYLEPLTWANRMRATLASVREEGVVEIFRIDAKDRRAYLVDGRGLDHIISGSFQDAPYLDWAANPENRGRVYVGPVSTQVADYGGRLIAVMAVPTYEVSVDENHPHPAGVFAGVLVFYIDAQRLADKFTRQIRSGKTGYAWVMDNQGTFLSHPEPDFVGKNAFTVRKQRAPAISFDAINRIQKEKMLQGQEGWGTYISGWHRGLTGEIRKLIAYAPVRLADPALGPTANPAPIWSVAVVAPASEVEGVVHSLYLRQFFMQVLIGLLVISSAIVMLNFRYERQFSENLEQEVSRQKEKLQKSEARYQGLVENAADLIYTVDEQGRILSINRYAANLFATALAEAPGRPAPGAVEGRAEDFLGRTLYEVFAQKSADFQMEWLRETKATGRSQEPAPPGDHRPAGVLVFHQHRGDQGRTGADLRLRDHLPKHHRPQIHGRPFDQHGEAGLHRHPGRRGGP